MQTVPLQKRIRDAIKTGDDATAEALIASDPGQLTALAEVAAAGRAKATGQPLLDAAATKGGLLLDLWAGLDSLR